MGLLTKAAALAALVVLAGCATSGLQAAGRLGDAGSAATLQAANAYTASSSLLGSFTSLHCQNYALATNETVLNQQPLCPYLRGEPASTQATRDIAALRALIDERAKFFSALNRYYTEFGTTARLDPIKLTDATKSVAAIADSTAKIMGGFPIAGEALIAAGARIEALAQIIEENHRLSSLRDSSADIRAVLPVIIATHTVEQSVLRSIAQANANERVTNLRGLSDRRLLDTAPIIARAQQTSPVVGPSAQTAQAWNGAHGRAYILNTGVLQAQEAVEQVTADNAKVIDSLQRLIRLHQEFEANDSVTNEDVVLLMTRAGIISNGPPPAPAAASPAAR